MLALLNVLLLVPVVAHAALFTKDSQVKMLDAKSFKKVMRKDETSLVAFVAPWCGHCQRMAPEFSKAAKGLHPLVPTYAVDCDDNDNKMLCAEQDVKGFPTVKVFPRGASQPPIPYEGERTASGFFHFTSRRVPNHNKKLLKEAEVQKWIKKKQDTPKALLLSKDTKTPLLWQVLASRFDGKLGFAFFNDKGGKVAASMATNDEDSGKSKLVLFGKGLTKGVAYDGVMKLEALSDYFTQILEGNLDLTPVSADSESDASTSSSPQDNNDATSSDVKKEPEGSTATGQPANDDDLGDNVVGSQDEPLKDEL